MDQQIAQLVNKAWERHKTTRESQRLIIGIAGIPGSGKTTLAAKVVHALNARHHESSDTTASRSTNGTSADIATFVPMDGYHLTRAQLSAMPDPATAHARRGAAFTFDSAGFLELLLALRAPIKPESPAITAPSFDHAAKDPVAAAISVPSSCRIVVLEGLYLALNEGDWARARECMDLVWFVEVDEATARRRLVKRHVAAGIATDEEDAGQRADANDLPNGREIIAKRGRVDEIVISREDAEWRAEGTEERS